MSKLWQKDYDLNCEVEAFTVGNDHLLDRELVNADCLGSMAQARMLAKIGILTAEEAEALVRELKAVVRLARKGEFVIRLQDEDVHTAVENHLTQVLGEVGKKIHTCRSRNDQVIVDLRLYGKDRLLSIIADVATLAGALARFSEKHRLLPMVGRTHMQRAMPSTVGLWAGAYLESMLDNLDLLWAAYQVNDQCPLGSAASYGVPIPIDRQLTSDLLGFARVQNNVLYANNSRGKTESVILSALAQVAVDLSRLAQDLILFSMPEFGYFRLPKDLCSGSSIMPQKRNPCGAELVRAKTADVTTCLVRILEILKGLPSGYNRDLQETKEPFMKGMATAQSCVRIMALMMERLEVVPEALRAAFHPEVYATDRALELVVEGVPFRDAYREVGLHLEDLANLDPDQVIKQRTHQGTSGDLGLEAAIARLESHQERHDRERERFDQALGKLCGEEWPLR